MTPVQSSGDKSLFTRAIYFTLGVILTALVGVLLNNFVNRARPELQVTSVTFAKPNMEQLLADGVKEQTMTTPKVTEFKPNDELMFLVRNHSWVPDIDTDDLTAYLLSMLQARETADSISRGMDDLREDLNEWPVAIDSSTGRVVFGIFNEHNSLIMGHIFGVSRREGFLFPWPMTDYTGTEPFFKLTEDNDGDFLVIDGIKTIPIYWSLYVKREEEIDLLQMVGERCANAIAHLDKNDLAIIKGTIDRIYQEEGPTKKIIELIDLELEKYSSLIVNVTITNKGKESFSIDSRAALYLLTKGERYQDKSEDMEIGTCPDDIIIELQYAVTSKSTPLTIEGSTLEITSINRSSRPIVIDGGKAVNIDFISINRMSSVEHYEALRKIYQDQGTQAKLAVLPLTGQTALSTDKLMFSSEYLVREINYEITFHENALTQ